jgi:hypothetical protein
MERSDAWDWKGYQVLIEDRCEGDGWGGATAVESPIFVAARGAVRGIVNSYLEDREASMRGQKDQSRIVIHGDDTVTIRNSFGHTLVWWEENGKRVFREAGLSADEMERVWAVLDGLSVVARGCGFRLEPEAVVCEWEATNASGDVYQTVKQPVFNNHGQIMALHEWNSRLIIKGVDNTLGPPCVTRCKIQRIAK